MALTHSKIRLNAHLEAVKAFASDRRGATAIEYALIAGGIFLAIVTVVPEVGVAVSGLFNDVKEGF